MQQNFRAEHFINRELSWLDFNERVLEEAQDPSNPLLERVKFLSIFSSNLDEFFMVRVAGLREQAFGNGAPQDYSPDGLRAITQLQRITRRTQELVAAQYRCWNELVRPATGRRRRAHPRPRRAERPGTGRARSILPPAGLPDPDPDGHRSQPSHAPLPQPAAVSGGDARSGTAVWGRSNCSPSCSCRRCCRGSCRWGKSIIRISSCWNRRSPPGLGELFGGFDVLRWTTFRITRDSDIELLEQESDDMLRLIEERLKTRQRGEAVRLEVAAGADPETVSRIVAEEIAARGLDGKTPTPTTRCITFPARWI